MRVLAYLEQPRNAAGKAGEPRLILAHNDAVFNASNKLTDRKSETQGNIVTAVTLRRFRKRTLVSHQARLSTHSVGRHRGT